MGLLDRNKLKALEKHAQDAWTNEQTLRNSHQTAEDERKEAYKLYNEELCRASGIKPRQTICRVPRYRWTNTDPVDVVVVCGSVNSMGSAVVKQVTTKNKIWGQRHGFTVYVDQLEMIPGRVLEETV